VTISFIILFLRKFSVSLKCSFQKTPTIFASDFHYHWWIACGHIEAWEVEEIKFTCKLFSPR